MNIFKFISSFFDKGTNLNPSIGKTITNNTDIAAKKMPKKGAQRFVNIYDPLFKLNPRKLELFRSCKRCFYIDRRLGIGHPIGYPFSLNNAVDKLLKKEFDIYRLEQKPHPICLENGINVIPSNHNDFDQWRKSGIKYIVPNTNLELYGKIDDVWIGLKTEELIIVDYKATSTLNVVTLHEGWKDSYKRQVEIYQWLLRKNGFKVSNTAYFVYCNGKKDLPRFDKKLHFDISLLPHEGDDSWVEGTINNAYKCLQSNFIPVDEGGCNYCQYLQGVNQHVTGKIS